MPTTTEITTTEAAPAERHAQVHIGLESLSAHTVPCADKHGWRIGREACPDEAVWLLVLPCCKARPARVVPGRPHVWGQLPLCDPHKEAQTATVAKFNYCPFCGTPAPRPETFPL